MNEPLENDPHPARDYTLDEEFVPVQESSERLDLTDLSNVKLGITAELGRCSLVVGEVLELKRGSVLPLDKLAGEMADLYINGIPFGRGEVVVLGDTLHVRIAEIHGFSDKEETGYE
jgi:flagellar motor switch protein FliN/FliY